MSQIAQALAKAKERNGHTTAPFFTSGAAASADPAATRSLASSTAIRKARNTKIFWAILISLSLPLTGFVLWFQLKSQTPLSEPETEAGNAATVSAGVLGSASIPHSTPKAMHVHVPTLRPEIQTLVTGLPISAVMPGDPARIVVAGRVVRAGDLVEGELTFFGIADGQLQFTDAKGAVYARRY